MRGFSSGHRSLLTTHRGIAGVRYHPMSRVSAGAVLTFLFAFVAAAGAQQVQYIDLTAAPQRVALRFPPPAPSTKGEGFGSGGGGSSVSDCAPNIRDPHAVAVYLDGVDGKSINPAQPFEVEFRFVNTGRLPITIPVSPDLSDLQPTDPGIPFTYLDLGLVVRVRNATGPTGYALLYGSEDHKGTTRVLKPGEWIRVRANLKLNYAPESCSSLTLVPGFWMHSNLFRATFHGFWEDSKGICVNQIPITPTAATVLCARPHGANGH